MIARAVSDINFKKIFKYLFAMIIIFAGCNHCVREFGKNPPSSPTGLDDWSLLDAGKIVTSSNNVREAMGSYVKESGEKMCPAKGYDTCQDIVNGFLIFFGLHETY